MSGMPQTIGRRNTKAECQTELRIRTSFEENVVLFASPFDALAFVMLLLCVGHDAPISISVYRYLLIGTKIEISVSVILLLILPILKETI
jgi:hypothetical protein